MRKLLLLTFILLVLPFVAAAPTINNTGNLISIEKEEYLLSEPLSIIMIEEPETITMTGPSGSYRYVGVPSSPMIYIPEESGEYEIIAKKKSQEDKVLFTVSNESFNKMASDTYDGSNQGIKIFDTKGRVLLNKQKRMLDNSAAYSAIKKEYKNISVEINDAGTTFSVPRANPKRMPSLQKLPVEAIEKHSGKRISDVITASSSDSSGTIKKVASGEELLRCTEWENGSCGSDWAFVQELNPGTEYSVDAPVGDVAYAEVGVATINAIKPIYKPGDTAELLSAILDTQGYLVDAHVNITITNPSGEETLIEKEPWNSESSGIYSASLQVTEEGIYDVEVRAKAGTQGQTGFVDNIMWTNFTVNSTRTFDIIRQTPVSIDPWSGPFTTTLIAEPEISTSGKITITERLPANFKLFDSGDASVTEKGNYTHLSWTVNPGEAVSYRANSPLVSPDLYPIGPVTLEYGTGMQQEEFAEARTWWMAIDPTETLAPVESVNTELDGTDLSTAQVSDITNDDSNYLTFSKNSVLTTDVDAPANSTPIGSVSSLSCTVVYTSEAYSPDAIFRVDDSFGGNALGSTTLPPSTGGESAVTLSDLQNSGNFDIADLNTLNVFVENTDGGKPQTISVDQVSCSVTYTELDVEPPTVTIDDPQPDTFFNAESLQFNYTPSDNVGFQNCSLFVDGAFNTVNNTPIVNGSLNSITANFIEGVYDYFVSCFDPDGNEGQSSTQTVTFDTTAPSSFSLSSPTNTTVSTDLTPTFSWTATTETNFVNYTLLLDDDPAFSSPDYVRETTNTVTNNSYTFSTILSANVEYYWKVIAEDEVGLQTESTETFLYTTDTIVPSTFDLLSPSDTTISADTSPFLDWESSSDTNFANYTVQFDDDPAFGSINHEYVVTAGASTSEYQIGSGEELAADTIFNWRVIAYDEAGQSTTSTSTFEYTTDNTAPTITLEAPDDSFTETFSNTIEFNYSTTDAADTVSSCSLFINGTSEQTDASITEGATQTFSQFLSNGFYEWWVACSDPSGNEQESTHRFLTVDVTNDNTAPNILLNFPDPDYFLDSSTVTFNYTPQDATGILNCSIYLDGSLDQTDSSVETSEPNFFTINSISEAQHSWSVACYDNSTNENFAESATQNFTIDLTNPVDFDLLSPDDNLIFNDNTPFLDWESSSDTNFANYTIELDNNADFSSPEYVFNTFSVGTSEITTTTLADDAYYWRVIAYDVAGNSQVTTTRNFTIDSQAPTYVNAVEDPVDPVEFNPARTYNFSLDVTDIRLDSVIFEHSFNGAFENVTPNSSGSTFWTNLEGIETGSYSYKWYMNDTAGNMNETNAESYEITKNTTTTNLFLDSIQNNLTINESSIVNITGELNWPIDGVITLRRNGTVLNSSVSPTTRLENFTTPGYYEINAEYSGNTNYLASSETLYVTVLDNIAPTVTLIEPENGTIDNDGLISHGFQVSDSNDIDYCELYVDGVLDGTRSEPDKDTTIFFNREYESSQSFLWFVSCTDVAGRQTNSTEFNLTIEINEFTLNLNPVICTDADGCTAANMNVSDGTFENHGTMNKDTNNFVFANLTQTDIPLGSKVLNVSLFWDKYQESDSGTFFLSYLNGSNWEEQCSQGFTTSSTATTDPMTCVFTDFPTVTNFNSLLDIRGDFFYTGNQGGRTFGTDYVELNVTYKEDNTNPSVELNDPPNGFETGSGSQEFNITASDKNLQNCTLYGDFSGSWAPVSTITVDDNLTSGVKSSFQPVDLAVGFFTWNAQCTDIASNSAFASQNYTINITPPDLEVLSENIVFESGVREDDVTTVNVTVENIGFTTAENFVVEFFRGNPDTGGVQLGPDQSVSSLAYLETVTLSASFSATIGNNDIYVRVDGLDDVTESDESNNLANNVLRVNAYHRFYGNTTKNTTLDTPNNSSFKAFVQTADSTGSIFFARGGSSISFADLKPLGKNTGGSNTSDDFSEADILLNMTGFNDSVNKLWANESDRPINVSSFLVAGQTVDEVPVVRSDEGFNFKTGILWDSSDDAASNTEYDTADAEDLIFVANSENSLEGTFGTQDYEAVVPAKLREYAGGPVEMVEIYVELT